MQALRWHDREDVRVEEVAEPAESQPDMTRIAVSKCGICGSDLAEYTSGPFLIRRDAHPLSGQKPPITLGHEFSGRVLASETLPVGTRVTADACWRCGRCEACLRGDSQPAEPR